MRCPDIDPNLLHSVKGFLDPEEGSTLFGLAQKAARKGPCLEIGSYCGKSALYLGSACREVGSVLFSIDHHRGSEEQQPGETFFDSDLYDADSKCIDTFPHFKSTIAAAGLLDTVIPIVCDSATAARGWATPLSLIFIDGGHSYTAAYADYCAWQRHLMPCGYLLIHDIFKNPRDGGQAPFNVYQAALRSGNFTELAQVKTLGILRRIMNKPNCISKS